WGLDRGIVWDGLNQQEGNSVPRWHHPQGGGVGLWRALHRAALERGVNDWITSTAAKELIVADGRVIGVRAENTESGQTQDYYARAIIVGTGGFASNLDMVLEHRPDLRQHRILEGSHVGATGSGHRMLEGVEANFTHMGDIWFYSFSIPDHRDPNHRRGLVIRGIPDAVWINQQGHRFHDENLTGGYSGTRAVLSQDPAQCWAVVDAPMSLGITVSDPGYYQEGVSVTDESKVKELLEVSPHIKSGDSLEELGAAMGLLAGALRETIDRYNSFIEEGLELDPDFGRVLKGRKKIEEPPFYALNYYPLARKNFGGVKTDLHCQVLNKYYEPIPGLYAAGEVAGMAGGHINGKAGLEGTMLGPSLFSGRVAGAWAAHEAGFGSGFPGVQAS
ncbi:MAG: FAD-binding protein, partial [Dehalococcoidia bacterium]